MRLRAVRSIWFGAKGAAIAIDPCPVCRRSPAVSACRVKDTIIYRCCRCGLGWWDFSSFDPQGFYEEDYYRPASDGNGKGYEDYDSLEPGNALTAKRRLARIRKQAPQARALLDVGCGLGHFLKTARDEGWSVSGYEVSRFAADVVRKRLGVSVYAGDLKSLGARKFDVVTAWDVLEHVRDPVAFLSQCRSLLSEEGIVVTTTGDFASMAARLSGSHWHLYNLPEHLFFHTVKSLSVLARRTGFRILSNTRPALHVPLSYVRERLLKTLRIRMPATMLDRIVIPVNLFDIMESVFAPRR